MDLEGIFSYGLGSREYFMISLMGPEGRKKESPFAKVLRGVLGGVQAVVETTDSACTLKTQETRAWPLVGRSLQWPRPVFSPPSAFVPHSCSSLTRRLRPAQGFWADLSPGLEDFR